MLFGDNIGVFADMFNVQVVILLLSVVALAASIYIRFQPDVSG